MTQSDDIFDAISYGWLASYIKPTTMKAHVFYYKWPRIKEDLVHEEHEYNWGVNWSSLKQGTYVYLMEDGKWYLRKNLLNGDRIQHLRPEEVPKEIRLTALILT